MVPAEHGQIRPQNARFDRWWLAELVGDGLPAESIGPLLTGVRQAAGKTQLRLAELLCAASGVSTVTRHEVSRWEREERIPNGFWLRWLALVLEVPLDSLERAAAVSRLRPPAAGHLRPPAAGHLRRPVDAQRRPLAPGLGPARRVDLLRRMDDMVGGGDLAGLVEGQLRMALARVPTAHGEPRRRRRLAQLAEIAQLAGWVLADAGAARRSAQAHVLALRAARAAGESDLVGLLLASLAHLGLVHGRGAALRLAEAGYASLPGDASATARALVLHRVAFAAARSGDARRCEQALAAADRAYAHRTAGEGPAWAYWLDEAELTAMTGRCFAALGRPRIAEPLLNRALASGAIGERPAALYAAWLAAALLDTGDAERACEAAGRALLCAVRLGSVRALRQVTALGPRLDALGGAPALEYRALVAAVQPYLPNRQPVEQGPAPPMCTGCG